MITAQIEPWPAFIHEAQPLLPLHWAELALNKDKVPLDPQYDIYTARDLAGQVLVVTLRQDGELVGYFIVFIAPGLNYKTCLTLTMDINGLLIFCPELSTKLTILIPSTSSTLISVA